MQDQLDVQKANDKTDLVFVNKPWLFTTIVIFIVLLCGLLFAISNGAFGGIILVLVVIKIWTKVTSLSYSFYKDKLVIKRLLHSDKVIHKNDMARIDEIPYVPGMYFGSGPVIKLKNGKVVPIGSGIKWDQPKLVMKIASIYEIDYTLVK